jgi:hypothetical protein
MKVPVPLSSLAAFAHGLCATQPASIFLNHRGFLPITSAYRRVESTRFWPYLFGMSLTHSKLFYPQRPYEEMRRLVVDTKMVKSPKIVINEMLQIDYITSSSYDILVHVRTPQKVLCHQKWYGLTVAEIHDLF